MNLRFVPERGIVVLAVVVALLVNHIFIIYYLSIFQEMGSTCIVQKGQTSKEELVITDKKAVTIKKVPE